MKITRTSSPAAKILHDTIVQLNRKRAKVGWFESAKYPDGTPVAYVAAIQEYGSPAQGIPPRPHKRLTVEKNEQAWKATIASGAKAVLKGIATGASVMEAIGLKAAGDWRKAIATLKEPALKESTVAARKYKRADKKTTGNLTKPLVDTGTMLNTLTNVVEDK